MTYYEQMFEILGLKPTKEQREIKKAYAQKVKKYHPEEDAEKWQELHHAYQKALEYAARPEEPTWDEWQDTSEKIADEPESEEFEKMFEEIENDDEGPDQSRDALLIVQRILENFVQIPGYSTPERWTSFLQSDEFSQVCEEEIVLQQLNQVVLQLKPDRLITALVIARMEQVMIELQAAGDIRKQRYVNEVMLTCRRPDTAFHAPPRTEAPVKKKKVPVKLLTIAALLAIVIAAFWGASKLGGPPLSEAEAITEIVSYLEEKYPDSSFETDDLYTMPVRIYPNDRSGDLQCGYRADLYDPNIRIFLFYWEDDGEVRTMCFDNYQKQAVTDDIGQELFAKAGITEGRVQLNWFQDGFYDLFGTANAQYHSRYDGDLKAFLEQETEFKKTLQKRFFEMLKNPYDKKQSDNPLHGRCLVYFKDNEVASVGQRITEPQQEPTGIQVENLEAAAAEFQMQIECIGLSGEFYERMEMALREDTHLESTLEGVLQRSQDKSDVPFMPHLMTSWYITGREAFGGEMQIPQIKEVADGTYLMGITALLQKNLDIVKVSQTDTPKSFLETAGNGEAVSYRCEISTGQSMELEGVDYDMLGDIHSQKCVFIFEKKALGITGSSYQVGITYIDTDEDAEENTQLQEVAVKMADQLYEYTDVVDEAEYIAVKVEVSTPYREAIVSIIK